MTFGDEEKRFKRNMIRMASNDPKVGEIAKVAISASWPDDNGVETETVDAFARSFRLSVDDMFKVFEIHEQRQASSHE